MRAQQELVFSSADVLRSRQLMKKIRVNHNYRRPFAFSDEETLMESIILSRCCLCQRFVVSKCETKRRFVKHELFFGVNYLRCDLLLSLYGSLISSCHSVSAAFVGV